jgi:putative peptide zinc metalloprotease protein
VIRALFSPSWYRVASLTPRLRGHVRLHRHVYRRRTWWVLQDLSTGQLQRFTPDAHAVIGLMDGSRNVQEIWEIASERLGDDAPSQDEMIRLLGQLHAVDALQSDVSPDARELLERHQKREQRQWQGRLTSPFAIQIPLVDPERFLARIEPWLRPALGVFGALLWLAVVLPALVLAGVHWQALSDGMLDRALEPQNLFLVWMVFPVLKTLHELGHAFATKTFGGEVHDMGVILLVLTPVPYVDASAASAFRQKRHRMFVGAAGMIVEVFVAALALYVWLAVQPGVIRTLAWNVMLIGSISTVLFNANPLLRYDGYYIFSDWLEMPNLRLRSNAYLQWLIDRYAFGLVHAPPPDATASERFWCVTFAVSSFVYRAIVVVAILLLVLSKWFFVGVLFGAVGAIAWIGRPLVQGLRALFTGAKLRPVRRRAILVCTGAVLTLLLVASALPVPLRTRAEGIVWIPEQAFVRPSQEGFVRRVVAVSGTRVARGALLFQLEDPVLATELVVAEARVREMEAQRAEKRWVDRGQAEILEEQLRYAQDRRDHARQRAADLEIRAGASGTFVSPRSADLPGRFVKRGELLGHVIDLDTLTVRTVISQDDAGLVQRRTERAEVRLAEQIDEARDARLVRVVPGASAELPSVALGASGGGEVATDPRDEHGVRAMQRSFQVDLELPSRSRLVNVGEHVHVRFDHGSESLAAQGWRRLRQLFLSRLHV